MDLRYLLILPVLLVCGCCNPDVRSGVRSSSGEEILLCAHCINAAAAHGPCVISDPLDHIIYPGETLDEIAVKYAVSAAEILKLNRIKSRGDIEVGQRLRIPISGLEGL